MNVYNKFYNIINNLLYRYPKNTLSLKSQVYLSKNSPYNVKYTNKRCCIYGYSVLYSRYGIQCKDCPILNN